MSRIVLVVLLFSLGGAVLFHWVQTLQEQRRAERDLARTGDALVRLIAIFPVRNATPSSREQLMKAVAQHASEVDLAYLYLHDLDGREIVSLSPRERDMVAPAEVRDRSLTTLVTLVQVFRRPGSPYTVHEFAKPVFEGGERTATVRLGLHAPRIGVFSRDRLSQLAMVGFFMLSTAIVGYYLMFLVMRRLPSLSGASERAEPDGSTPEERGFLPALEHLDRSVSELKARLKESASQTSRLTTQLGVTSFEKDKMSKVLDALDFGVLILDLRDHITLANRSLLGLLKRDREQVVDRPLAQVLPREELLSFLSEPRGMGRTDRLEIEFKDLAPGEIFEVAAAFLRDAKGGYTGKLAVLRNVTHARRTARAQQQFVAQLAHELRAPLTSIKSYSEMIVGGEVSNGEMIKEFHNTINEETNRLSLLIENLLNVSKMEMGGLTVSKDLVRTDWLLDACLPAVEASATQKRVLLRKQLPDVFPTLLADKELLKVALVNLLGNAVKYTPENGAVTLTVRERDHVVVFEISDTGFGIAREELPHLGEKFFRSSDPRIRKQTGTGLGLATVFEIVRLHGGKMDVQSELGKGTTFTLSIPTEEYTLERR